MHAGVAEGVEGDLDRRVDVQGLARDRRAVRGRAVVAGLAADRVLPGGAPGVLRVRELSPGGLAVEAAVAGAAVGGRRQAPLGRGVGAVVGDGELCRRHCRRRGSISVHIQRWPDVDVAAAAEDMITLIVQINGKVRDRILVPVDITDEAAKSAALNSENVKKFLEGKPPRKVIVVPHRLVNIVV